MGEKRNLPESTRRGGAQTASLDELWGLAIRRYGSRHGVLMAALDRWGPGSGVTRAELRELIDAPPPERSPEATCCSEACLLQDYRRRLRARRRAALHSAASSHVNVQPVGWER
jgi:hypothetical protein